MSCPPLTSGPVPIEAQKQVLPARVHCTATTSAAARRAAIVVVHERAAGEHAVLHEEPRDLAGADAEECEPRRVGRHRGERGAAVGVLARRRSSGASDGKV